MNLEILKKTTDTNTVFDFFLKKNGVKPEIYYTIMKYFARATQFLAWPITFIYFHLLFKISISGRKNLLNVSSPFIIISNHVAFYDSFVFRLVLGAWTKKLPLRFMAVNNFRTWYLNLASTLYITDFVYMLFGVFVVVKGRGIEKNLEEAVNIINNGGDIVMYPEGSIVHDDKVQPFKLGAAALAKKTGVPVIPISMKMGKKGIRKDYIIKVGEPIRVDSSLTVKEISEIFYDKVRTLHGDK